MAAIILENLRSAYNVGNIVRTADALGRDVIIAGYTPSPLSHTKVQKTSLGAEQMIRIYEFPGRHFDGSDIIASHDAVNFARQHYGPVYALEITENSSDIRSLDWKLLDGRFALLVGNEPDGVEQSTLSLVDGVLHIPMVGSKESLNVGQAGAIAMWHSYSSLT